MNTYDKGDLVRVTGVFATVTGVVVEPDAVFCEILDPGGVTTTYTYGVDAALVHESTGTYYLNVDASQAGVWYYRFHATGVVQAAGEGTFVIGHSNF